MVALTNQTFKTSHGNFKSWKLFRERCLGGINPSDLIPKESKTVCLITAWFKILCVLCEIHGLFCNSFVGLTDGPCT